MKPRNLLTIDKLTPGVEYIKYVDEKEKDNLYYARRIIGYVKFGEKNEKKAVVRLGKYRNNKGAHQFIFDSRTVYGESDTDNYQSFEDYEKDLEKSRKIQENALRNTMAHAIATNSGNADIAFNVLQYLPYADETKYPTGNKAYVPIFKNEIKKQIEDKFKKRNEKYADLIKSKYSNIENGQIRSNSLNNNEVKHKPKHSRSLPKYEHKEEEEYRENEDDIIPNKPHNKTQKKTRSIIKTLEKMWKNSRSRVHIGEEKGGKRQTRKNKRKHKKTNRRNTRKHKKTNITKKRRR